LNEQKQHRKQTQIPKMSNIQQNEQRTLIGKEFLLNLNGFCLAKVTAFVKDETTINDPTTISKTNANFKNVQQITERASNTYRKRGFAQSKRAFCWKSDRT
jgi:hypothetical protein